MKIYTKRTFITSGVAGLIFFGGLFSDFGSFQKLGAHKVNAQKADDTRLYIHNEKFEISVNTNNRLFDGKEKGTIAGSFKNLSEYPISISDIGASSFQLAKQSESELSSWKSRKTFLAWFSLAGSIVRKSKEPKTQLLAGETVEFEVPLDALDWHDPIISFRQTSSRQSIRTLLPGSYNFFMSVEYMDIKNSTEQDRKFITLESNQIPIEFNMFKLE